MASVGSTTAQDSVSANQIARRTLTALIIALQSPNSDYDLKQEIDSLGKFVGELSFKFVIVYMGLDNVIKSSDISSDLKRKLETVRSQWEGVMEILVKSIMLSGDIADVAVSTCKDFLGSVLPLLVDDSVSLDSKKYMIGQFIEQQDASVIQAQEMSQGFSDTRTGVENLVKDVKVILDDYDVPAAEERIRELDTQIKDLLNDLDQLRQQIADVSSQLDIVIAATSATGIFGFLCPVWWIATAVSAAQIPSLKVQLSALQSQQDDKNAQMQAKAEERRRLQDEVVFVSALRSSIEEREPEIEAIKVKLGALATVWAAIAADSQALLEKLEHATDSESQALFKLRVQTAEEMYRKLQTALEAYRDIVSEDSSLKKAFAALMSIRVSFKA